MATNANQQFNVDVQILFGSVWKPLPSNVAYKRFEKTEGEKRNSDVWIRGKQDPWWEVSLTDWNRRCTELPTIQKSVENWTGRFQVGAANFTLADTDGSVRSRLYASNGALGHELALFSKVSENPTYWNPVFVGNVTRVERGKGLVKLQVEDGMRNLYNSRFVPDYQHIATRIGNSLYGTVRDVVGTNIYLDDRGDTRLVKITQPGEDSIGMILGGIIGGAVGFLSAALTAGVGAAAMPSIVGGVSGALGNIPTNNGAEQQWYYQTNDYNAIPDHTVLGGQNLKFFSGSIDPRAGTFTQPLFTIPSQKVRGGTFQYGIYGTIEIDDILHNAKKGDFIYAELPLIYSGSPADIIRNMLAGTNSTVRFVWPDDFSEGWNEQALPLRHIEAFAVCQNFENGGPSEAIDTLAREFGFTFYLDENNKFALRTIRETALTSPTIIGTLDENWNVLNDGFTIVDDVQSSYTDIAIKFQDVFSGQVFGQEVTIPTGTGTFYNAVRRTLSIDSRWIHDSITGQFMATRLCRRYGTTISHLEGDVSLYSVPIALGDIVACTGWACGTNAAYEILSYSKNFGQSITHVVAEKADWIYRTQGFFYLGTNGAFATVLCNPTEGFGTYGTILDAVYTSSSDITLYWPRGFTARDLTGSHFRIGTRGEEVMFAISRWDPPATTIFGQEYYCANYKIHRAVKSTLPIDYLNTEVVISVTPPIATVPGFGSGTYWKWF